jgi:hypothetical protein
LINPKTVFSIAIAIGIVILGLNAYYNIWPLRL